MLRADELRRPAQRRPRPRDRRPRRCSTITSSTASRSRGRSARDVRVVVDCANGSACAVAPRILAGTGATRRRPLRRAGRHQHQPRLRRDRARSALARHRRRDRRGRRLRLDGDADRCVAVDERGEVVDGDQLIGIIALDRLARERSAATASSSSACCPTAASRRRIDGAGGRVARTPVGDKYILDAMLVMDAGLGGEKSGHVIIREHANGGDGIVTALEVLRILARTGKPLSELAAQIPLFPQQQRTIPVRHKDQWEADPTLRRGGRGGAAGRSLATAASSSGRRAPSRRCGSWSRARTTRTSRRSPTARGARGGAPKLAGHRSRLARRDAVRGRDQGRYVRNRRLHRAARGGAHPARGPRPPRIPRLRLGRHRARDDRTATCSSRSAPASSPTCAPRCSTATPVSRRRPRPHALGDARPAERPQRPSAHRLHRRDHGHPQRHHRELQGAARRPARRAATARVRDRHRGARAPRRGGLRRRHRRRRARGAAPGARRLRGRGHARGRAGPARRRAHERAAHRRPRRRRELPRLRRGRRAAPTRAG